MRVLIILCSLFSLLLLFQNCTDLQSSNFDNKELPSGILPEKEDSEYQKSCFQESEIVENYPLRFGENLSDSSIDEWRDLNNFDSWGPNLSKSLPKVTPPQGCKQQDILKWRQKHLLSVLDKIIAESYNYCHHHIPFWSKEIDPDARCSTVGKGFKGTDCSNLTSFAYLYAFGGTWFTSNIQKQSGISDKPHLAPGVEVIGSNDNFMDNLNLIQPGDLLFLDNPAHGNVVHVQIWTGYQVGINFSKDRLTETHRNRANHGDFVIVDSTGDGVDSGPRYRLFNKSPKMYDNNETPKWWRYVSARRIILNPDFVWPIDSVIVSNHKYSYKPSGKTEYLDHNALADLQAPHMTPVYATRKGRVSHIFYNNGASPGGNGIYIEHQDIHGDWSFRSVYTHLYQAPPHLKVGDSVDTGDFLGAIGRIGNSRVPHLHFMIQKMTSPPGGATETKKTWKNIQAFYHDEVNEDHWGAPRYTTVQQGEFIDIDKVKFPELEDIDLNQNYRQRYQMLAKNEASIYTMPDEKQKPIADKVAQGAIVEVIGFKDGFLKIGENKYVVRNNFTDIEDTSQSVFTDSMTGKTELLCRSVNTTKFCDDGVFRELNNGNLINIYKNCPNLGYEQDETDAFCALWRGVDDSELANASSNEIYQGKNVVSYFYIDPRNVVETDKMKGFFVLNSVEILDQPYGNILKTIRYDGEDPNSSAPYRVLDQVIIIESEGDFYKIRFKQDGEYIDGYIHASSFSGQI